MEGDERLSQKLLNLGILDSRDQRVADDAVHLLMVGQFIAGIFTVESATAQRANLRIFGLGTLVRRLAECVVFGRDAELLEQCACAFVDSSVVLVRGVAEF